MAESQEGRGNSLHLMATVVADANEQICIAAAGIVPNNFRVDQFVDLLRNAQANGIQALAMAIDVAVRAAKDGASVYDNGEIMFV